MIAPLVLALAVLFFSGCATVTRGTKDTLVVESDPAGADVRLSSGQTGKTPTSFKLSRKEPIVVTISREGYETVTVNVNSQIVGAGAAGMAGNVLVGGVIGVGIDAWSGATKSLKPNPVRVNLVKLGTAEPAKSVAAEKTLAEKLKELKVALDSGLLSQDQYERQRAKLVGAEPAAAAVVAEHASGANSPEAKPETVAAETPASNSSGGGASPKR